MHSETRETTQLVFDQVYKQETIAEYQADRYVFTGLTR